MEDCLALRTIELDRLLPVERVHVGVTSIREDTALDDLPLEPRRGIAEGARPDLDDVLECLLGVALDEGRALERSQFGTNAQRYEIVQHGFADVRVG